MMGFRDPTGNPRNPFPGGIGVGVSFVVLVQHGAEFGVVDATSLVFVKFGKSCLHLLFK